MGLEKRIPRVLEKIASTLSLLPPHFGADEHTNKLADYVR
jgi:hypothetical protein